MTQKLRIVIITQGISRIVNPIVNYTNGKVVGIIEDAPRNFKPSLKLKLRESLSYFFGENSLRAYCSKKQLPYTFYNKNKQEIKNFLNKLKPDVMVVYSMSKLLKEDVFTIPKYGTINLHPSFLPEYKGRNPWFWMYVHTNLNPGVSLHHIDKGEDTGDLIYQEKYEINLGMKSPDMQDLAIGKVGVGLILKALEELFLGKQLKRHTQIISKNAFVARQPKLDEVIIDWGKWDVEKIWHILRGTELWYNPISQPSGFFKGQRWEVLDYDKNKNLKIPVGQVKKQGIKAFLQTKEGVINLRVKFSFKNLIKSVISI